MDPVSQGVAGALAPASASDGKYLRLAAFIGFLSGLLADADVFIRSSEDPLLSIDYHRQFTHSLVLIPFGGLIAGALMWPFLRKRITFKRVYFYATLGYATHALLDACTNYGTQLLWPFSDTRIAWNIISIIDPVYTGTLILVLIISCWRKSVLAARAGLVFAVLYLLAGLYQREMVTETVTAVSESRGHAAERIVVHPSIGNLILWRSIYETDGLYYVDAVRAAPLSPPIVYEGGSIGKFDIGTSYPGLDKESVAYKDIERFRSFSNDLLVIHEDYPDVIGDLRYSILPNGTKPLWGISINEHAPDEHIEMMDYERSVSDSAWDTFFKMLRGEKPRNAVSE